MDTAGSNMDQDQTSGTFIIGPTTNPTLGKTLSFFGAVLLSYMALTSWEQVFDFNFGIKATFWTSLAWSALAVFVVYRYNLLSAFTYAL